MEQNEVGAGRRRRVKGRAGVCQGVRTDLAEKVQVLSKDIAWSQLDWEFSQIREICDNVSAFLQYPAQNSVPR